MNTFYECRSCKKKYLPGVKGSLTPFRPEVTQPPVTFHSPQGSIQQRHQQDYTNPWISQPFFVLFVEENIVIFVRQPHFRYFH